MCFNNAEDANLLIDLLELNWQIKIWLINVPFEKNPDEYKYTVIFNLGFRIKWSTLMDKLGDVREKIKYCQYQNLMIDLNNEEAVKSKVMGNLNLCFRGNVKSFDINNAIEQEQRYAKRTISPINEPKLKHPRF